MINADELSARACTGPRYTSYPPATEMAPPFDRDLVTAELGRLGAERRPVSLYAHLPFCRSLCWYCGCNVIATKDRSRGTAYVDRLLAELAMVAKAMGGGAPVAEIALGGGSPNFLEVPDLARLVEGIEAGFDVLPDARRSIELDPRDTTPAQVELLASLGFRSLSVGVQDFAPAVQAAIHRQQSFAETRELVEGARAHGFDDLNLDIVYGLPLQTEASFAATLEAVVALRPDRIALFGYAHLPERRPHQSLVERAGQPLDLRARAQLLLNAIEILTAADYVHLGLDHFARRGSQLALAARNNELDRTFQGYVVRRADAIIGLGATAITTTERVFWQNRSDLSGWAASVEDGILPVERGHQLSQDDRLRRVVIRRLMCDGWIDLDDASRSFGIDAAGYFATELRTLAGMADLVTVDGTAVRTTLLGRLLVRNVCMTFDRYAETRRGTFSPTV